MGRVLGLDWGEKRIGLALSDEGRTLARTLPVLEVSSESRAVLAVARLIRENDVDTLVIGDPLHMNGGRSKSGERAGKLASKLEALFPLLRVIFRDERLTSREAEAILKERSERTRGRKGRIDQIAAAIILQDFLDGETR